MLCSSYTVFCLLLTKLRAWNLPEYLLSASINVTQDDQKEDHAVEEGDHLRTSILRPEITTRRFKHISLILLYDLTVTHA
jgi:hypothetical protein